MAARYDAKDMGVTSVSTALSPHGQGCGDLLALDRQLQLAAPDYKSAPRPPKASGMATHSGPAAPAFVQISRSTWPCASHRLKRLTLLADPDDHSDFYPGSRVNLPAGRYSGAARPLLVTTRVMCSLILKTLDRIHMAHEPAR